MTEKLPIGLFSVLEEFIKRAKTDKAMPPDWWREYLTPPRGRDVKIGDLTHPLKKEEAAFRGLPELDVPKTKEELLQYVRQHNPISTRKLDTDSAEYPTMYEQYGLEGEDDQARSTELLTHFRPSRMAAKFDMDKFKTARDTMKEDAQTAVEQMNKSIERWRDLYARTQRHWTTGGLPDTDEGMRLFNEWSNANLYALGPDARDGLLNGPPVAGMKALPKVWEGVEKRRDASQRLLDALNEAGDDPKKAREIAETLSFRRNDARGLRGPISRLEPSELGITAFPNVEYEASHFGQHAPDLQAHSRSHDYYTNEGEPVRHITEVQSDRFQQRRKVRQKWLQKDKEYSLINNYYNDLLKAAEEGDLHEALVKNHEIEQEINLRKYPHALRDYWRGWFDAGPRHDQVKKAIDDQLAAHREGRTLDQEDFSWDDRYRDWVNSPEGRGKIKNTLLDDLQTTTEYQAAHRRTPLKPYDEEGFLPLEKNNQWAEHMIRRHILEAIKENKKYVTLSTGDQMADIFGKKNNYDHLQWTVGPKGITLLHDGKPINIGERTHNLSKEDLINVVGKDTANKILERERALAAGELSENGVPGAAHWLEPHRRGLYMVNPSRYSEATDDLGIVKGLMESTSHASTPELVRMGAMTREEAAIPLLLNNIESLKTARQGFYDRLEPEAAKRAKFLDDQEEDRMTIRLNELLDKSGLQGVNLSDLEHTIANRALERLNTMPLAGTRMISGPDISVGGTGMRQYYDNIYRSYLHKLARQYGGKPLEEGIKLDSWHTVHGIEITPEMVARIQKQGGLPFWSMAPIVGGAASGLPQLMEQDDVGN